MVKDEKGTGQWEPEVGDRVVLPWGLDEVEGEVVNVYGSPLATRLVVRVNLPDAEGAEEFVLPVHMLRPVESGVPRALGDWHNEALFLRDLAQAIERVLPSSQISIEPLSSGGLRPDLVVSFVDGNQLFVEVKSGGRNLDDAISSAVQQLRRYVNPDDRARFGLVVTMFELPDSKVLQYSPTRTGGNLAVAYWRGHQDDLRLKRVLNEILVGGYLRELDPKDRAVTPSPSGGWDVLEPQGRAVRFHSTTQREAVEKARELAARTGGQVVIRGRGGKVRHEKA